MKVTHIENNFEKEIENVSGYSVVDFWAEWCGPCKMFGPIFESVSEKYDNIKFAKLNVDNDLENICKKYAVMSIPTIILFKDGIEVKRNIGFFNEDDFKNFLEVK